MEQEHLRKIINGSGYLLQIAVMHRVRQMQSDWEVIVTEHPWRRQGEPAFIDVVLGRAALRLVVECKRPGGGEYTFLVPHDGGQAKRVRCGWVEHVPDSTAGRTTEGGWHDFNLTYNAYEAHYAIVSGQDRKKPILESLAAEAVEACDALAAEELDLAVRARRSLRRMYVPTIVTTAPLRVVRYKPENIDPKSAILVGDDVDSHEVEFLWFRKSLTTALTGSATPEDLRAANADRERSVLIVSAGSLEPTLRSALELVGDPRRFTR